MINPSIPTGNREAHLKQACSLVGATYVPRPSSIYTEMQHVPKPLDVVTTGMRNRQSLEDIRDDLALSQAVHAVVVHGGQLQRLHDNLSGYEARRDEVWPLALKHSRAVFKDIRASLGKLPDDPMDREAVFESDTTDEYKRLLSGFEELNIITGLLGDIHEAREVMAICRYVIIDDSKEGDVRTFLALARKHDHDEALVRTIRGDFGERVKATVLPTHEQVMTNVDSLNKLNTRLHRKNVGAIALGSQ